jgi:hypothetical protein
LEEHTAAVCLKKVITAMVQATGFDRGDDENADKLLQSHSEELINEDLLATKE